jgi:hypothetical protein
VHVVKTEEEERFGERALSECDKASKGQYGRPGASHPPAVEATRIPGLNQDQFKGLGRASLAIFLKIDCTPLSGFINDKQK